MFSCIGTHKSVTLTRESLGHRTSTALALAILKRLSAAALWEKYRVGLMCPLFGFSLHWMDSSFLVLLFLWLTLPCVLLGEVNVYGELCILVNFVFPDFECAICSIRERVQITAFIMIVPWSKQRPS